MAKKMTKKEFFEVLENAKINRMNNFENLLNCLVASLYAEADVDEQKSKKAEDEETKALYARCSEYRRQEAHDIFKQLEARGYYEK